MYHNLSLRYNTCYVYIKKAVLMNKQLHYSILVNLILYKLILMHFSATFMENFRYKTIAYLHASAKVLFINHPAIRRYINSELLTR